MGWKGGDKEHSLSVEEGSAGEFGTICRIPVRPFVEIAKAGQPARLKTITGEDNDAIFGCYSPPRRLRRVPRGRSDGPRYRCSQRGDGGGWRQDFRWRPEPGKQREVATGAAQW